MLKQGRPVVSVDFSVLLVEGSVRLLVVRIGRLVWLGGGLM